MGQFEIGSRPAAVRVRDVTAGETWDFRASGTWVDWFIPCGPSGYRSPAAEFLDIWPKLKSAPLFALVARVADEQFVIGTGVRHTFSRSGTLYVCANDVRGMRWNNWGRVTLSAERVPDAAPSTTAGALPPQDSNPGGSCSVWMTLVDAVQRTQGFLFIAGLLVATGFALAFLPQGVDLVRTVLEDAAPEHSTPDVWPLVWLIGSAVLLGLVSWFWARAIVEYRFGARSEWEERWFLLWIPRLFGLLPFAFLIWTFYETRRALSLASLALVLAGAAVLLFVISRKHLARLFDQMVERQRGKGHRRLAGVMEFLTLKAFVLGFGLFVAVVSMAAVLVCRVGLATAVGPAAVVLFAVALIIPPMVLAIQVGAHFRFPFTPVLVAFAFLFSLWNDNHALELVPSTSWDKRPDLVTALQQWRSQFGNSTGPIPIIFVAAEGGASRAGYWTGDALGVLEEKTHGQFSRHLFLISSISGSDVGTAAFVASLRDEKPLFQSRKFDCAIDDFTGRDFLSPTLAAMLFPDLAQRFLFWSAFPDRASYLERSWEAGWTEHCRGGAFACSNDNAMQAPFLQLWSRTDRWLPILMFGGAREEDGRRILTSNVAFNGSQIDADDFHALTGADVSLSTAMLNGARFPFVSPGGTMPPQAGGHVLDGGYFDGAGIETMREAEAVVLNRRSNQKALHGALLCPIFILLENGAPADTPKAPRAEALRSVTAQANAPSCVDTLPSSVSSVDKPAQSPSHVAPRQGTDSKRRASNTRTFAPDVLGPLVGLLSSKDAHSAHLRFLLEHRGDAPGGEPKSLLFEIRVCNHTPKHMALPLDWTLSNEVKQWMHWEVQSGFDGPSHCDNAKTIAAIAKLLNGT